MIPRNPWPGFGWLGWLVEPFVALLDLADEPGCWFAFLAAVAFLLVVLGAGS